MRSSRRGKPTGPPIAVIEEIADNIYSIKFILQSLGYNVRSFCYRDPFLPELVAFSPRLIVVDMMIPEGGGFDVIRGVRGELSEVPLLAITADAMDGEIDEVYDAGGQDVLNKPYQVTDLQGKLKKWMGDAQESDPGQ